MDLYEYQKSERRLTQRQVKLLFMEKDPHCFWCRIEVREYILRRGQHSPHDLATVDHLFDRLEHQKLEIEVVLLTQKEFDEMPEFEG